MALKVAVKILVCNHLILTVRRRVTRGLADSINEPLGTFVTSVLSLAVYRSPTRPETCSRTCTHYRRKDKCTQHHQDIARCCDRTGAIDPIDFSSNVKHTEKMFRRRMTRRIDSRTSLTHSRQETNGLHFIELSLPRTILISRLPIKVSSKRWPVALRPGVAELYGPLLIFMARK